MEKAYIRSLAEIDAEVVADSRRLRPLLADVPRPQLYGTIPAPLGGGGGIAVDGASTKKVSIGHKKTLVSRVVMDGGRGSDGRTIRYCNFRLLS